MKYLLFITLFAIGISYGQSSNLSIPYTLEDRERSIRMEEKFNSMQKQIENNQISSQRQMDDLRNLMYILISSIFALFGFVLWDRKSTLSPFGKALKESEQEQIGLKQRVKNLEEAIVEIAKAEPKFSNILHRL